MPASALWALLPSAAEGQMGLGAAGYGLLLAILGVGSILGALLMPRAVRHLSPSLLLAASSVLFGLGTLSVAWCPLAVVLPVLLVAGMAWTGTLTTLNAAMQLSAAPWVRARAIAMYLLVLMGGQGVGAFLWGAVSAMAGVMTTLAIAGGLLLLVGLSVTVLPLRPETNRLDRSIHPYCSPEPHLVFTPEPTDGPVVVTVVYRVVAEKIDAFVGAVGRLRDSRRRTGATAWDLERPGEHPDRYREEFRMRSWGEYQASRAERWTGHDASIIAAVLAVAEAESESHAFLVRLPRKRRTSD